MGQRTPRVRERIQPVRRIVLQLTLRGRRTQQGEVIPVVEVMQGVAAVTVEAVTTEFSLAATILG